MRWYYKTVKSVAATQSNIRLMKDTALVSATDSFDGMFLSVLFLSVNAVSSCVGASEVLDTSVEGFDENLSFSVTELYVTPVTRVVVVAVTPGSLASSCVTEVVPMSSVEK